MTGTIKHPEILLLVRFKSALPPEELTRRYKERMSQFRALPGLLQKYYVYDPASEEWGGFYIWDSRESLDHYKASDLRKSIPDIYEIIGEPRLEVLGVKDVLRPERA